MYPFVRRGYNLLSVSIKLLYVPFWSFEFNAEKEILCTNMAAARKKSNSFEAASEIKHAVTPYVYTSYGIKIKSGDEAEVFLCPVN